MEGAGCVSQPAPLWYMAQGGRPIPAAEWRGRAPPDLFCREGDEAWSAFDPANPPAPIH